MGYVIYTDGACKGNPGPGGWGAVIILDNKIIKEVSGVIRIPPTTKWS